MLFNSFIFVVFFAIVFPLYWALPFRWQNRMLLVASYIFYGYWDWRFLSLLLISSFLDFFCAQGIERADSPKNRKILLLISMVGNLGILGFFKYFNFFVGTFHAFLTALHLEVPLPVLKIILPVGISFYTFQTMSYSIDVFRGQMKATRNLLDFMLYVSFFPQLVAGPIERARRLLPQISSPRVFNLQQFYEGGFLFFWGLFEKIYIADNLAKIADPVFTGGSQSGPAVLLGLYAFAFQIFCDFDGYSNMARGLAKMLGIELMVNFNVPYFSSNPREFWQRWHISLSSFLRDYLYIPLGGNRKGSVRTGINLMVTMLLGGLWHGASWTFVLWGAYHGVLLIVHRWWSTLTARWPRAEGFFAFLWKGVRVLFFFHLVCLSWLIFRSPSWGQLNVLSWALFGNWTWVDFLATTEIWKTFGLYLFILPIVMIFQYRKGDLLEVLRWPWLGRAAFYILCYFLVIFYGVEGGKAFIYFQF